MSNLIWQFRYEYDNEIVRLTADHPWGPWGSAVEAMDELQAEFGALPWQMGYVLVCEEEI